MTIILSKEINNWLLGAFMSVTGLGQPALDYRSEPSKFGYSHYLSREGTCEDLGIDVNEKTFTATWNGRNQSVDIEIVSYKDRQTSFGKSVFPSLPMPDPGCIKTVDRESGEVWTYPSTIGRDFYAEKHGENFTAKVAREVDRVYEQNNAQPRWKQLGL